MPKKKIHIVKRFLATVPLTFCDKYVERPQVTAYPEESNCLECRKKVKKIAGDDQNA